MERRLAGCVMVLVPVAVCGLRVGEELHSYFLFVFQVHSFVVYIHVAPNIGHINTKFSNTFGNSISRDSFRLSSHHVMPYIT